ncbi:MAG TPA: hypothetical protein VGI64_22590 [Streptosporangiaceae bacterium]
MPGTDASQFSRAVETALDVESAHVTAPGVSSARTRGRPARLAG